MVKTTGAIAIAVILSAGALGAQPFKLSFTAPSDVDIARIKSMPICSRSARESSIQARCIARVDFLSDEESRDLAVEVTRCHVRYGYSNSTCDKASERFGPIIEKRRVAAYTCESMLQAELLATYSKPPKMKGEPAICDDFQAWRPSSPMDDILKSLVQQMQSGERFANGGVSIGDDYFTSTFRLGKKVAGTSFDGSETITLTAEEQAIILRLLDGEISRFTKNIAEETARRERDDATKFSGSPADKSEKERQEKRLVEESEKRRDEYLKKVGPVNGPFRARLIEIEEGRHGACTIARDPGTCQ